jgi:hypothetical protein
METHTVLVAHQADVAFGSWLRENSEIEFANGNFVSTSINLKNKSAGDGCRDKTIEKTILRAFRARTFSRSQGQSRPGRAGSKSGHVSCAAESGNKFRALATQRWAIAA